MGVQESDSLAQLSLPPGFRFYPTDEELLVQYLCRKVAGHQFSLQIIAEIDLYKFDPWVLPSKAIFGEKEWYFFSPRDRKYPNGSRPNRVAGSGYWKATGTDKIITTEERKVGIKKALVFYVGKAPKGTKTNWIMHEYRLLDSSRKSSGSKLDDWVLCRIYKKNSPSAQKTMSSVSSKEHSHNGSTSSSSSHLEDVLDSLPEIDDRFFTIPRTNSHRAMQADEKININNLGSGSFDWASLVGFNPVTELVPGGQNQGISGYPNSNHNDIYAPTLPALCHLETATHKMGNPTEEEVQSGLRSTQRMNNSTPYCNSGLFTHNVSNSFDPYGLHYPSQTGGGFGFRQ
ncbi:hypothetical protein K2173_007775 [Erythroxylum novogranatense]|uniref:NAC domain-containing protein n=1 Tax=Erythroxylum novogranatense TaxID=1862640 RepID=A0AAV8TD44_9ROSI|nr:hypothetical protein K2173_007775 [Erythroxylum novogranatense]